MRHSASLVLLAILVWLSSNSVTTSIAQAADRGPGVPTFSEREWEGMAAELWRQGKTKDAIEWQPALGLVKQIFVDQQIRNPSPRMICKFMNKFALFNHSPREAETKLRELLLAADGAGIAIATRQELLALEDGDVAPPRPQAVKEQVDKPQTGSVDPGQRQDDPTYTLGGAFSGLQRIRFGSTSADVKNASPVALEKSDTINEEFLGQGLSGLQSAAYPLADRARVPVQFVFRKDMLVGICIDEGASGMQEVATLVNALGKSYTKSAGMPGYAKGGYKKNVEKWMDGSPHSRISVHFRDDASPGDEAKVIVQWDEANKNSTAQLIFRKDELESVPEEGERKMPQLKEYFEGG